VARHSRWFAFCATIALYLSAFASLGHADVVFTNIVGNCCGGYLVGGSNFGTESLGTQFSPTQSTFFQDAQVVVFTDKGLGDGNFNMYLFSDANRLPGTSIANLGTLTAPVGGGILTATGPQVPLIAGTEYWLVLTPFDDNTWVGWEEGGTTNVGVAYSTDPNGQGSWNHLGPQALQFQIDGVPEPSSIVLMGSGMVGLFGMLRRRMF
jgi:hypothetical protein